MAMNENRIAFTGRDTSGGRRIGDDYEHFSQSVQVLYILRLVISSRALSFCELQVQVLKFPLRVVLDRARLTLQGVIFLPANKAFNPHFELSRVVMKPAVAGKAKRYSIVRIKPNTHIIPREDVCVGKLEVRFGIPPAIDTPAVTISNDLRDQSIEPVNQVTTSLGHRGRLHFFHQPLTENTAEWDVMFRIFR